MRQRVAGLSATNTSAQTSEPLNAVRPTYPPDKTDGIPYNHIDITSFQPSRCTYSYQLGWFMTTMNFYVDA
jgi:hypothetical protein